ncbi:MAG: metallophosphoesterase [Clostridia bacterium]|nr:metallophosphoesterase [Clostridia bacterium]
MILLNNTLHIGASAPFDVLHASDTHLTYADEREPDHGRKMKLAQERAPYFANAEKDLAEIAAQSGEHHIPILHTGDLIDFVSMANLDAVKQFTREHDVFMAAGNHEFSLYVGEAKEDAAYREKSLHAVQAAFSNDIRFSSRCINGVNFVALDNSYYLIEEAQLAALKAEAAKGLPIVLMLHTPLYTPALYDLSIRIHNGGPAYLMAVPEEKMRSYSPDRYEQQLADETTLSAYEYILSEPLIKAVLAGHIHHSAEDMLPGERPQWITGLHTLRKIHIT